MNSKKHRMGITSGGNWIVDRIKILDALPGRGMLGNILSEEWSSGGAPANVLANLAKLKAPFPLAGVGTVGRDQNGQYLRDRFTQLGIDVSRILTTPNAATSYTDVMTDQKTGDRAFFHCRGANALFAPKHVSIPKLTCRIFHLGYLLLLDRMDQQDRTYGTVAARFLASLQKQQIKTSVDVVSEESDRFRTLVPAALPYVDYLILNEIETGRTVSRPVRKPNGTLDASALVAAVDDLYRHGNMELVVVHMPEGVYIRERNGKQYSRGSLVLPKGFIKSGVGAGDAFCAGMLYGLHEGWSHADSAQLGNCCAAASLSESGATNGMKPLAKVLALGRKFPERKSPVKIR